MTRSKDLRDPRLPIYASRRCQLILQGTTTHKMAEERLAGIAFHEERAAAATKGSNGQTLWWAIALALLGIVFLLVKTLIESRR
jgi:hypothetical protein